MNTFNLQFEAEIIKGLKRVHDPEIPINIYDLGLIYKIDVDEYQNVDIQMTLTAPNCPIADQIFNDIKKELKKVEGINRIELDVVFDPPWNASMMSEEAKLELGYL